MSMDFINGLPKSAGKDLIMVIVDRLTKYAQVNYLSQPYMAQSVGKAHMDHVFKLWLTQYNC